MLQHSLLPPSLIPKCLDVLLKGTSERDFMRIVVETVQSLRNDSHLVTDDSELGEQSDDSSDDSDELEYEGDAEERAARRRLKQAKKGKRAVQEPQQAERRKELDLRCLFVVKALLERVMSVRSNTPSEALTAADEPFTACRLSRRIPCCTVLSPSSLSLLSRRRTTRSGRKA